MQYTIVIPARHDSERIRTKPLIEIGEKSMLQHVWERAIKSSANDVIIATDHQEIESVATKFGAKVCMTRCDHKSGTDRLQEVASLYGYDGTRIMVNVQGDEPLIPPSVIDQVAKMLFDHQDVGVATLSAPIEHVEDFLDPNIVKVVTDKNNHALMFSRAPIPWPRADFSSEKRSLSNLSPTARHVGLYAYRVNALNDFVSWPTCAIEQIERLEQLRFIYHGVQLLVHRACENVPEGVDTIKDLERVRNLVELSMNTSAKT